MTLEERAWLMAYEHKDEYIAEGIEKGKKESIRIVYALLKKDKKTEEEILKELASSFQMKEKEIKEILEEPTEM